MRRGDIHHFGSLTQAGADDAFLVDRNGSQPGAGGLEDAARTRVTGIFHGHLVPGLEQEARTQIQPLLRSVHHNDLLGGATHSSRSRDVLRDLLAQGLVAARKFRIAQRVRTEAAQASRIQAMP